MLGSLQTDMTRQGVSTTKKGECAACSKPIIGQVCTALGRTWHPEHFNCVTCEVPLGATNFFERDGRPFCERDYHEQFAPRCAYCSGPILDVSSDFVCFLVYLIDLVRGHTWRLSVQGLVHQLIQKCPRLTFSQYSPKQAWLIRDLLYN